MFHILGQLEIQIQQRPAICSALCKRRLAEPSGLCPPVIKNKNIGLENIDKKYKNMGL